MNSDFVMLAGAGLVGVAFLLWLGLLSATLIASILRGLDGWLWTRRRAPLRVRAPGRQSPRSR